MLYKLSLNFPHDHWSMIKIIVIDSLSIVNIKCIYCVDVYITTDFIYKFISIVLTPYQLSIIIGLFDDNLDYKYLWNFFSNYTFSVVIIFVVDGFDTCKMGWQFVMRIDHQSMTNDPLPILPISLFQWILIFCLWSLNHYQWSQILY